MKKTIFLTIILGTIIGLQSVQAQWQLGAEAGFQINDTRIKGAGDFIGNLPASIITPMAQLTATRPISNAFDFRTGIGFSQKGFQVAEALNVDIFNVPVALGARIRTTADYIHVPIEGMYTINDGSQTQLFVSGGGQVGYAMGGRLDPRASVLIDINLPNIPINLNQSIYNRWDLSGTAGIGLKHQTEKAAIVVQGKYIHSFTNFLDNPIIDLRIKPNAVQFSIGVELPIGSNLPRV